MAGRHSRSSQKWRLLLPALAAVIAVAVVALAAQRLHRTSSSPEAAVTDQAVDAAQTSAAQTGAAPSAAEAGARSTPTPSPVATAPAGPAGLGARIEGKPGLNLAAQLAALAAPVGAGGVSIAALNTVTGVRYSYGATSGMPTGSVVKLDTLQTVLLQHQDAGTPLSEDEVSTATRLIQSSDNDAQDAFWAQIGSDSGLAAANARLGPLSTVPGTNDFWGLTTTSAQDQLTLLNNLIRTGGPLSAASQGFILNLMRNVESDQRWGVGVLADAGTTFANKNGWLGVDDDEGRWLVNSDGIVTIHGQTVLISILTQHNTDEQSGITLVESLASAIAPVIAP